MILTLTPNPSTDVTMHLDDPIVPGGVNRATTVTHVAGGKGINVSRAAHLAGTSTTAVFPATPNDPFLKLIDDTGIHTHVISIDDPVRINTTITEQTGRTTKINGPGPILSPAQVAALTKATVAHAVNADVVVLSGSLPGGVAPSFYTDVLSALASAHPGLSVAVDTSDKAMKELGAHFATAAPTIIKPNGFELGQLVGRDGLALELAAESGDLTPVVDAALSVVARGVPEVLVTLGGAGAVLATDHGVWKATPAPTTVRSTVGAGDSALTGYLLATLEGADFPDRLRRAVAYGTAATGLPGTTIPSPDHLDLAGTHVESIHN